MNGALGGVLLRLLGAGGALAIIFWYLDGVVLSSAHDIGWGALFLSFLFTLGLGAADAKRWRDVATFFHPGVGLTFRQAWLYFSTMTAVGSVTVPTVANTLGQATLLKKGRELSLLKSLAITLYPRLFDIATLLLLAGPALLWIADAYGADNGPAAMVVALLWGMALALVWKNPLFFTGLILKAVTLTGALIPPLGRRLAGASFSEPPDAATLRSIALFTTLRFVMIFLRLHFLLVAFDLPVSLASLFFAVPLLQGSLLLAFAPGGLGSLEFGWTAVLVADGIATAAVSSFLVWNRIFFIAFNFAALAAVWLFVRVRGNGV